jgi:hypothetical protein
MIEAEGRFLTTYTVELFRLEKVFLKETYIKVLMGENLSGAFLVKNNLKQGDVSSSLVFNVALESA